MTREVLKRHRRLDHRQRHEQAEWSEDEVGDGVIRVLWVVSAGPLPFVLQEVRLWWAFLAALTGEGLVCSVVLSGICRGLAVAVGTYSVRHASRELWYRETLSRGCVVTGMVVEPSCRSQQTRITSCRPLTCNRARV